MTGVDQGTGIDSTTVLQMNIVYNFITFKIYFWKTSWNIDGLDKNLLGKVSEIKKKIVIRQKSEEENN